MIAIEIGAHRAKASTLIDPKLHCAIEMDDYYIFYSSFHYGISSVTQGEKTWTSRQK
jgi:hypothetical protein